MFPPLDYIPEIVDLIDTNTFSIPVKSMITLLAKKNIVQENFFDGFEKDDDIEKKAIRRINTYSAGDDLEDIFHLIQVWGGNSGRGIYIFGQGYDWNRIAPHYQTLVNSCLDITEINHATIKKLVNAVSLFNSSVANMGISFITKHTRFWLYCTLGKTPSRYMTAAEAAHLTHKHPLGFLPSAVLNDILMQIFDGEIDRGTSLSDIVHNAIKRLPTIKSECAK